MIEVFVLRNKNVNEFLYNYFERDVKLAKTKEGAPYIVDEKTKISLSHKDNYLVVALSDKDVGIDIERIYKKDTHKKIALRYFSEMEYEFINSAERFFYLWTRKEALGKLLGTGLNSKIISINVIKNSITYDDKKYFFDTNTTLIEGYCLTVAGCTNNINYYDCIDGYNKNMLY